MRRLTRTRVWPSSQLCRARDRRGTPHCKYQGACHQRSVESAFNSGNGLKHERGRPGGSAEAIAGTFGMS